MIRKDGFVVRDVGGSAVIVPTGARVLDLNGLVVLNDSGRLVWDALSAERSEDELVQCLTDRYDVSPDQARADVRELLERFAALGIIQYAGQPI
jgi:hypothetical protein